MDLGLQGKVALVTGASQGIGFAIARELAQEGATVAMSSRTPENIERAAAEVGGQAFVHDTGDLDAAPGFLETVEREVGPIDILVANTGGPPGANPLEFTREQWEAAHRELVVAPYEMITWLAPGMRERGFGRVVSVSSWAAVEPIHELMLSSAHRPGLLGMFKTLARELGPYGITLNTILPGRIATARITDLYDSPEEAGQDVPVRRLGDPADIGAAAAFLCSVRAGYITGEWIRVDGGITESI